MYEALAGHQVHAGVQSREKAGGPLFVPRRRRRADRENERDGRGTGPASSAGPLLRRALFLRCISYQARARPEAYPILRLLQIGAPGSWPVCYLATAPERTGYYGNVVSSSPCGNDPADAAVGLVENSILRNKLLDFSYGMITLCR